MFEVGKLYIIAEKIPPFNSSDIVLCVGVSKTKSEFYSVEKKLKGFVGREHFGAVYDIISNNQFENKKFMCLNHLPFKMSFYETLIQNGGGTFQRHFSKDLDYIVSNKRVQNYPRNKFINSQKFLEMYFQE
jgi:hypothetical protein